MDVTTHSLEEFNEAAIRFAEGLSPSSGHAAVVTLSGELGAGKTTFVQALARALGVIEPVTSPTFVLEKIYQLEGQRWERLIHIDAYRLKGAHELGALGWEELIAEKGNLIVLEWPERVEGAIPGDAVRIKFDIHGDGRTISINGREEN